MVKVVLKSYTHWYCIIMCVTLFNSELNLSDFDI
jgi:hypothetical protein